MELMQFWDLINLCRTHSASLKDFTALPEEILPSFEPAQLNLFDKWVWHYLDQVKKNVGLAEVLYECLELTGGDTGLCYGGWLIAQGREFFETVMKEPKRAAERLPSWDDVWEGESVFCLAER